MPNETQETTRQEETLPSDVVALCALIARIIVRCLREKDPHALSILSLMPESEGEPSDAISSP